MSVALYTRARARTHTHIHTHKYTTHVLALLNTLDRLGGGPSAPLDPPIRARLETASPPTRHTPAFALFGFPGAPDAARQMRTGRALRGSSAGRANPPAPALPGCPGARQPASGQAAECTPVMAHPHRGWQPAGGPGGAKGGTTPCRASGGQPAPVSLRSCRNEGRGRVKGRGGGGDEARGARSEECQ